MPLLAGCRTLGPPSDIGVVVATAEKYPGVGIALQRGRPGVRVALRHHAGLGDQLSIRVDGRCPEVCLPYLRQDVRCGRDELETCRLKQSRQLTHDPRIRDQSTD